MFRSAYHRRWGPGPTDRRQAHRPAQIRPCVRPHSTASGGRPGRRSLAGTGRSASVRTDHRPMRARRGTSARHIDYANYRRRGRAHGTHDQVRGNGRGHPDRRTDGQVTARTGAAHRPVDHVLHPLRRASQRLPGLPSGDLHGDGNAEGVTHMSSEKPLELKAGDEIILWSSPGTDPALEPRHCDSSQNLTHSRHKLEDSYIRLTPGRTGGPNQTRNGDTAPAATAWLFT